MHFLQNNTSKLEGLRTYIDNSIPSNENYHHHLEISRWAHTTVTTVIFHSYHLRPHVSGRGSFFRSRPILLSSFVLRLLGLLLRPWVQPARQCFRRCLLGRRRKFDCLRLMLSHGACMQCQIELTPLLYIRCVCVCMCIHTHENTIIYMYVCVFKTSFKTMQGVVSKTLYMH